MLGTCGIEPISAAAPEFIHKLSPFPYQTARLPEACQSLPERVPSDRATTPKDECREEVLELVRVRQVINGRTGSSVDFSDQISVGVAQA